MIEIGKSIVIEVVELNNDVQKYRSRIIEENDDYIIIDYPTNMNSHKTAFLPNGTNVNVIYARNDNAIYQFNSKIVAKLNSKIPALAMNKPKKNEIKRIQRRKFVRINTALDVAIHSLDNKFSPFTSVTADISGGGVSVVLKAKDILSKGDKVRVFLSLPLSQEEHFYVIVDAEVVFLKERNNVLTASLKFIDINNKEQQNIVQFCFKKEREQRKKELS